MRTITVMGLTLALAATAGAQDKTTRARAAQEITQVNGYAEKFFRRLAEDDRYSDVWSAAVAKKDWAAAARLAAEASGAPVSNVWVGGSLPVGGDGDGDVQADAGAAGTAFATAVTAARGPWIGSADAPAPSVRSADSLVICFNLVIIRGCYVRTTS